MRKNVFLPAFLLILSVLSVDAQLFWKVSRSDIDQPSYLFGTHHLIDKESIPVYQQMIDSIKAVDVVVGEMDMSNMLSIQMKLAQGAMMKDTVLSDLITAEEYAMLEVEFKEVTGMKLSQLERMKPMMLSTLHTVMMYQKLMNLKKAPEGVDAEIQKAGKKLKKEIYGLETPEQQIDILFNFIPLKRQAELLVEQVKDKGKAIEGIVDLNAAYLAGDLDRMEALFVESEMEKEEELIILGNRNDNWMIQLNELFPKKSCLVAVGSLHLVGDSGLIQQLRKAGYTVEALE